MDIDNAELNSGTATTQSASNNSTKVATTAYADAAVAAKTITLTGDVTGSGASSFATTLATVNANVGSFGSSTSIPTFTVNAKGLMTAASGNAVIAPAGTLTGTTLNSTVVTSSLTRVGASLGVGVTAVNTLDVEGNSAIGATYSGTSAAPTNGMIIEGIVGFGTAVPVTVASGYQTVVAGNSANYGSNPRKAFVSSDANTSKRIIDITGTGASAAWRLFKEAQGTDTTLIYLNIASDGKTSIGQSAALSMLDVAGNCAIGSYAATTAAPTNGLAVSGQVAIGTATPVSDFRITTAGGNGIHIGKTDDTNEGGQALFEGAASYSDWNLDVFQNSFRYFGDSSSDVDVNYFNNGSGKFTATFQGSTVIGTTGASATTATDGFLYIPTCAGAPTGTPTTQSGKVPMIYDTTNNNFYIYNGSWKKTTTFA